MSEVLFRHISIHGQHREKVITSVISQVRVGCFKIQKQKITGGEAVVRCRIQKAEGIPSADEHTFTLHLVLCVSVHVRACPVCIHEQVNGLTTLACRASSM